jgi:hypothetical protein
MSEKKGWGSSVMGLFVVRDDANAESASAPAGEPAADAAASPDLAAPSPAAGADFVKAPPAAPGGRVDFPAVYEAAGIDADEQARVAKAAELLHALPPGTAAAKQIVEASLKAFGVPLEKIIEAGEKEIRALAAYVATGAADTRQVLAESQQRIAQYEQEIQRIRQVMDERVAEQQGVERTCDEGKLEVARVLEFFGHSPAAPAAAAPPPPINPSERSV